MVTCLGLGLSRARVYARRIALRCISVTMVGCMVCLWWLCQLLKCEWCDCCTVHTVVCPMCLFYGAAVLHVTAKLKTDSGATATKASCTKEGWPLTAGVGRAETGRGRGAGDHGLRDDEFGVGLAAKCQMQTGAQSLEVEAQVEAEVEVG
jgi:hypothetical protein